jgi:hypothetical protein
MAPKKAAPAAAAKPASKPAAQPAAKETKPAVKPAAGNANLGIVFLNQSQYILRLTNFFN